MQCEVKILHPEAISKALKETPDKKVLGQAAELFKALGDPTRLTMLTALAVTEMCVCDLAAVTELSSSAVSHQLRLLRQLSLVGFRKKGKVVYYRLADDHVRDLLQVALEHVNE